MRNITVSCSLNFDTKVVTKRSGDAKFISSIRTAGAK